MALLWADNKSDRLYLICIYILAVLNCGQPFGRFPYDLNTVLGGLCSDVVACGHIGNASVCVYNEAYKDGVLARFPAFFFRDGWIEIIEKILFPGFVATGKRRAYLCFGEDRMVSLGK